MTTPWDYDVVDIGFGPAGQTMAALLGQKGHRVGVFERWPSVYPLPRAGHVDHEIMRILQSVGAAEDFEPHAISLASYDWLNGKGELLLSMDWDRPAPSGWKSDYLLFQPDLQDALLAAVRRHPSVELNFGWAATGIRQFDDHAEVDLAHGTVIEGTWVPDGEVRTVTAGFVVGADGANSTVRSEAGLPWVDRGFQENWLVIDIEPHDPDLDIDMPGAGQYCDPKRPVSLFRWLGRGHSRWEFMLLPGETPEEMTRESRCWELLSRWKVTPDDATIIRRTVYTFRSLYAASWRHDRILLIGDAAHLMPPFLGQGMCSGLRDAANLAWKLDLVLSGRAEDSLLDHYTAERLPHVQTVITISVELGRIICISDPEQAAARDEAFRTGQVPPLPEFPILTDGVLQRGADGRPTPGAGTLSVQPRVHHQGRTGRLDDVVGTGWTLLSRVPPATLGLSGEQLSWLDTLNARTIQVTRAKVPGAVIDLDAVATRWFDELDADVVLVRPDFYVYGASRVDGVKGLVESLRRQLEPHWLQALA
ncbi:bifunctional 3-(3-hydroxy-phenyl)propionate/3-hydroxycinnamic acid hydroxylase [Streptomyces sp. NPDC058464]|uniref:bifunctional 3-(3-hydroxy-phenyl)propionate/3-hydroxycinnamic acid hydroxylase MhpA n=1 Tax=Streptomyces sp. NPDC058464 TaxID=3346511 RepID=UPI003646D5E3